MPFIATRVILLLPIGNIAGSCSTGESVLPADRFLEVDYEELVADREAVTRRLIEFCGTRMA